MVVNMRTADQIEKIKSRFSDPVLIENVLSDQELNHLIKLFETAEDKNAPLVYKNTGPVTLDIKHYINDPVILQLMRKIKSTIGEIEIAAGFFFKTDYPHIIHNDDTFELPDNVYKGITIPLKAEGVGIKGYPKLCFFKQNYFHGPSKFFNGDKEIPTYYNKQVYDYSLIDGLTKEKINDETYLKYFTHLKPQWLEGLSLLSAVEWRPGSMIIFDSVKLHCASDFRKLGITHKLAISIFTKQK